MINRRRLLLGLFLLTLIGRADAAYAKDGDSSGGSGSGSGSGSSNSGSGSGSGPGNSGQGGGDDDRDDKKREDDDRKKLEDDVAKGKIAPVSDILEAALKRVPGRVIRVRLNRENGNSVYRVRILSNSGRRADVFVDGKSRRVLEVR